MYVEAGSFITFTSESREMGGAPPLPRMSAPANVPAATPNVPVWVPNGKSTRIGATPSFASGPWMCAATAGPLSSDQTILY